MNKKHLTNNASGFLSQLLPNPQPEPTNMNKYENKVEAESPLAQKGDIAYFEYEVRDLNNKIIYTKEELKIQEYYVDKENIMMGLRNGIKLMKKGETITFIFPSHMGYGYRGDTDKISTNEPLICTVNLIDLKKDPNPKN